MRRFNKVSKDKVIAIKGICNSEMRDTQKECKINNMIQSMENENKLNCKKCDPKKYKKMKFEITKMKDYLLENEEKINIPSNIKRQFVLPSREDDIN